MLILSLSLSLFLSLSLSLFLVYAVFYLPVFLRNKEQNK